MGRQIRAGLGHVESFSKHPLLDPLVAVAVDAHLLPDVHIHRDIHKSSVKERDAGLDSPGHHGLVGPEAVVQVQLLHLSHGLLVELLGIRSLVKVEVASKYLISPLSAHHHLHAERANSPCHEVHGRGGSDGRHIKRFQFVNDIRNGVNALLRSEDALVVHGTDELCDLLRCFQIWAASEPNAEGVQPRPVSQLPLASLNAALAVARHDRRDQGRVQTSAEKHTVRHIGHQVRDDRRFESLSQGFQCDLRRGHDGRLPPIRCVVHLFFAGCRIKNMAWWEDLESRTCTVQRLELAGDPRRSIRPPTNVQGNDADGVSRHQETVALLVIQDEGEHATDFVLAQKVRAVLRIQVQ
mmetsp:Transcript_43447/g.114541  ORF Transcript_43447/g.114541 Transcript_43447/m.114541 type:complete len:353 (+) Transcript_43447:430-1488(+)